MKKYATLTLGLLLGLSSLSAMANEAATSTPVPQVTTASVATSAQPQTSVTPTTVTTNANSININTASAAEIQDKLVGIGAKKAQAIVDYRTKNGNFVSVEQLTEVSGIGKATLDKNRDRILLQ